MEERKIYFTCETKVDWDTYKELDKIKYRKVNRLQLFLIFLAVVVSAVAFFTKILSLSYCLLLFGCSVIALFTNVLITKTSDRLQGQQKVKYGKDVIDYHIELGDRIYVSSSCEPDRTYEYALVEKVYETKENVILVMPFGVTLMLLKANIKSDCNLDFKQFIFDKCYSLKKLKFKKVKDGKKKFGYLVFLWFFVSIVVLMFYFYLKTPENWRELGRNPKYSSSQQSTSDNSSVSSSGIIVDSSK